MNDKHESPKSESGIRLQKVLASAGLGSRRDCEELISQGRVEVDRKAVTELGTRVDPQSQEIRVDGEAIRRPKKLYFAVNKPVGIVTTNDDPSGRARVIDLVPTEERVFAVGRLDRSSEGLILVTNDGEFANRITHPRYGVEKAYLVRVAGAPSPQQLEKLKKGVHLAEGFARAQSIVVKKKHGQSTDLVIVLSEGRNREIRRILARVGHKVLALKRIAVGPVKLGDLPVGESRRLMPDEIAALLLAAKQKRRAGKPKGDARKSGQTTSKAQSGARSLPADEKYVQKQALMAEPLSLDDLLKDDMDEGPLVAGDMAASDPIDASPELKGGVIEYDDEFSSPPPPPRSKEPRGKRPRPKLPGRPGKRKQFEDRPRENFGKKRGGKRVFGRGQVRTRNEGTPNEGSRKVGPREEGRPDKGRRKEAPREGGRREEGPRPAGVKSGNFRFRPKGGKKRPAVQGSDNQRRGNRRGGGKSTSRFVKKVGKQGGKRKGRR